MKLNKSKCYVLHLGQSNTGLKYEWDEDMEREVWISSSSDPVTEHVGMVQRCSRRNLE